MIVYVVMWHDYDEGGISAVFKTYENAEGYIKDQDKMTGLRYSIYESEIQD